MMNKYMLIFFSVRTVFSMKFQKKMNLKLEQTEEEVEMRMIFQG